MYGILGTILGVFLGAPITYIFAMKMFNHQRYMEASAKFKESFIDELIICRSTCENDDQNSIISLLNQCASKHEKAIILFRPFIPSSKLKAFDQACLSFQEYINTSRFKFADISGITQEVDLQGLQEGQIKGKVKQRIERILEYAPTK